MQVQRFRFTTSHLIYATAVLAVSIGLFGVAGILIGFTVNTVWFLIFQDIHKATTLKESRLEDQPATSADAKEPSKRGFTLVELLVVIAIIAILVALLLPAVSHPRRPHQWYNYYQIATALRQYHDDHGALPASPLDESGMPTHSWRVLLLPYLAQRPLYDMYRFDEPWDSENNLQVAEYRPDYYRIPGDPEGWTSVQAIVGPQSIWERGTLPSDEEDALLFVECELQPVIWTSPEDLTREAAADYLTRPPEESTGEWSNYFFFKSFEGRLVASSHGGVFPIRTTSRDAVLAWATPSSEKLDGTIEWKTVTWRKMLFGNWIKLATFVIVVFLPITRIPLWYWSYSPNQSTTTQSHLATSEPAPQGSPE